MATEQDLENTQKLFDFLQGTVPEGIILSEHRVPRLTADQAWVVIWYIQNQYCKFDDDIERCDVCGDLYDAAADGECLDYGSPPYHFCGACCNGPEALEKEKQSHQY